MEIPLIHVCIFYRRITPISFSELSCVCTFLNIISIKLSICQRSIASGGKICTPVQSNDSKEAHRKESEKRRGKENLGFQDMVRALKASLA